MRYEVPQFIDVKDKIFGPFTIMQFFYIFGGGGFAYLLYRFVPSPINMVAAILVIILAGALGFYKVNGRPLLATIESAFYYIIRGKMYVWHHTGTVGESGAPMAPQEMPIPEPDDKISQTRLKDIAWGLDVLDKS